MYVESIELKEFRGIKECHEKLEFAKFTILIGKNDAGKTTILEALSLLPFDSRVPLMDKMRSSIIRELHAGSQSIVYGYYGNAIISYIIKGKSVRHIIDASGKIRLFIENKSWNREMGPLIELWDLPSESIGKAVVFLPNSTRFLSDITSDLTQRPIWGQVIKAGAHVSVIKNLIKGSVDDRFTEALISFDRLHLRKEFQNGGSIYVDSSDLGEGVKRTLLLGMFLETIKPKLVLWDDVEVSLHPLLLKKVLKWLASENWQVIIATQSIDVLHELATDIRPENFKVILLRKTADDVLYHEDLSLEELEDVFSAGHDPRHLTGRLGL